MGGPFQFGGDSTAKTENVTVADQGQFNKKSTVFQGQAKGASGKGAKLLEQGSIGLDKNSALKTGGLDLGKLTLQKGASLTLNYTTPAPEPVTAPTGGGTNPSVIQFVPPEASQQPSGGAQPTTEKKSFSDKVREFFQKQNTDGTTSINFVSVGIAGGTLLGIVWLAKTLRGK